MELDSPPLVVALPELLPKLDPVVASPPDESAEPVLVLEAELVLPSLVDVAGSGSDVVTAAVAVGEDVVLAVVLPSASVSASSRSVGGMQPSETTDTATRTERASRTMAGLMRWVGWPGNLSAA